jgi:hypothetical protein
MIGCGLELTIKRNAPPTAPRPIRLPSPPAADRAERTIDRDAVAWLSHPGPIDRDRQASRWDGHRSSSVDDLDA